MTRARRSGRAIVIDEHGRLLLFFGPVAGDTTRRCWYPPGGRLEDGESFEEATVRELAEEVGLYEAQLGPVVWERSVRRAVGGAKQTFISRFFLVRTESFTPDTRDIGHSETGVAWRWWTADELDSEPSSNLIPPTLAKLVRPLIDGVVPDSPIVISDN